MALATGGDSRGEPSCWRGGFNYDKCCHPPPHGNPECFDLVYTYGACCKKDGSLSSFLDCRDLAKLDELPKPLRCQGTPWVSAEDWEELFHAHRLSQVVGTSFKGWPDMAAVYERANASSVARLATEEDCLFGWVMLLLHVLPTVERRHGPHKAIQIYMYANRLRYQNAELEELDCRWNQMTNHLMFESYPLLLEGDSRLSSACPEGAPRIYVYDTGALAAKPLSCSRTGFWASEVYVDRFLRRSGCREHDWKKADLFFVPVYLTCWELQEVGKLNFTEKAEAGERLADKVRSLPYWGRKAGLDHVFLFGASAWQMPGWRSILRNSIILAVESRPIESEGNDKRVWHCQDCFQPWKDVVIPPVTPLTTTRSLMRNARPADERTILMSWHGQHANASDPAVRRAYRVTNESVRLGLLALAGLPSVSLGGPVTGYTEVLGNSQFCLCPKGASSYTSRVFEALFAGCIPVILSDEVRLPFADLVDWSQFSIRWPMAKADESLYEYLSNLLANDRPRVLRMQAKVADVRCWFDYFNSEQDPRECSPHAAVLHNLGQRVRQMPTSTLPPPFEVSPP
eukprot:TRINITY_DN75389_c0_g1_i1.p1 TRINITY_DN75389_c0_g1~~TRINITY_DN75389_c0_g1_i1.p1  ORF type:complete len:571 (-),score=99.80 TRINITY_DN75389_c0_g1_i1:26-1738(-)